MFFLRIGLLVSSAVVAALVVLASLHSPKQEVIPHAFKQSETLVANLFNKPFVLKNVDISGIRALDPNIVDRVLAPYFNKPMTTDDLAGLSTKIADAYEERGAERPLVMIPLNAIGHNSLKIEVADFAAGFPNKIYRFGHVTPESLIKKNVAFDEKRNINLLELEGITKINKKEFKKLAEQGLGQNVSLLDTHKMMYDVRRVYENKRLYPPRLQVNLSAQGEDKLAMQVLEYEAVQPASF